MGRTMTLGKKIIAALAGDRYGIAVGNLGYPDERVRALALAIDSRSAPVAATRASLEARTYPLTREVIACYNVRTGAASDPVVGEFLRFVLSAEGQRDRDDGYLPIKTTAGR